MKQRSQNARSGRGRTRPGTRVVALVAAFALVMSMCPGVAAGVNRWFKLRMGSLIGTANALGNVAGIVFALIIAALAFFAGLRKG